MTIIILFAIPAMYIGINFIKYLVHGKVFQRDEIWRLFQIWTVIIAPILFLISMDLFYQNNCCGASALFSPNHRYPVYLLMVSCMLAYTISICRSTIFPPIPEFVLQVFLILGLIFNIILCKHITTKADEYFIILIGNIPIILLFLISIAENHHRLKRYVVSNALTANYSIGKLALAILNLKAIYKYPVLIVCLIPLVGFLSLFSTLFGQNPDSIIRAFTDTYKHGFSQLDYLCENVKCIYFD